MRVLKSLSAILLIFLVGYHGASSYMLGNDPTRRAEYLDPQEKFLLEWEVLWRSNRIVLNVTVETRGYVALGFANNDNEAIAEGVDMLIAGVFQHGKAYFLDHHMYKGRYPEVDLGQDYVLNTAWESKTHTFLSFSRLLDTCDPQDYPITDNKVSLLWAYGEKDNHESAWEYGRRGSHEVYLLDQDFSRNILRGPRGSNGEPKVISKEKLDTWTIPKKTRIPSNETAYLCTMHRGPRLQKKHHVIGFDVHFHDQKSRQRVHHLIVYKCNVPQGLSSGIFEPFVGLDQGQACYMNSRPSSSNGALPAHFCTELYLGWAVGGRAFFTPNHVGFPLATSPNEYYMVQVHYDNPQQRSDLVVDFRIDFFYTSQLRSYEGGIMGIGHDVPGLAPSLLIPPNTVNHQIHGHCSSECTKRMYPAEGIKIVAGLLHSHNSGRRLRLRHFGRNNPHHEQPWLLYDDNYSNAYQPFRLLHLERKILPGDQLTMECTYDSTWNNGSSVVGGFATKQEMCIGFVVYYNKIRDYTLCRSEIVSEEYREYFLGGIGNVTWIENQLDWVVMTPRTMAGYTAQQISDNFVNWNRNTRRKLQRFHEVHPHVGKCSRELYARTPQALQALIQSGAASGPMTGDVPMNLNTPDDFHGTVGYPHRVRPYIPPKTCSYRG